MPSSEPTPRAATGPSLRPVLAVWLFIVALTSVPYLRAWVYPPAGKAFLGVFYAILDVYNYLSYVQQAEDGAFLFINKLSPEPHRPALANLEWWAVGRISALLGGQPGLAYRILGALLSLLLIVAVDRWLRSAGLPATHRFPALLLVFTGGGLGGILFTALGPPAWRFLDLTTGLFPFVSILVNPHFVAGTCLLAWSLWAFCEVPGARGQAVGILLGTALGLVRPYDLVLLLGIRSLVVAARQPASSWARSLLPLAGLAPVVLYNYWVFYRHPPFRVLSAYTYSFPQVGSVLLAVAPPLLLLALVPGGWKRREGRPLGAGYVFTAWALVGAAFLFQPFSYSLQFLVNWGLPLLALCSLGLSRWRPVVTLAAAVLFCSTGLLAIKLLMEDNYWFVPAWKLEASRLLRGPCRRGDVALVPPDLGLFVNAYSSCSAYVAHPVMRDYARRKEEAGRFYERATPAERDALLDAGCVRFVLLPGPREALPGEWPSAGTPFAPVRQLALPGMSIRLFERRGQPNCPL
jgi:hypothetical protein